MIGKRGILLILLILVVLGGVTAGVVVWLRHNTGPRLLARAELAVRAGRLDKALRLANSYVAQNPADWRGYFCQADAYARQGKYDRARDCLTRAQAQQHDEAVVGRKLAETYSYPAAQALAQREAQASPERFREAIAQIGRANEILEKLLETLPNLPSKETGAVLDVRESLARNFQITYPARLGLAKLLRKKADTARETGLEDHERDLRIQSREQRQAAANDRRQAIDHWLAVVEADDTRAEAAVLLVRLCLQPLPPDERAAQNEKARTEQEARRAEEARKDKDALAKIRAIIERLGDDAPPVARMLLKVQDLRTAPADNSTAARKRTQKAFEELLALSEKHPDERELDLGIAQLALVLRDKESLAEAEKRTAAIIEEDPRHYEARLLHAQALMTRGAYAEAERELFRLKTDYRMSPPALYWYAKAAHRVGKTELAREAMRQVAEIQPAKEPEHSLARAYLARMLMRQFPLQAFQDARALFEASPGSTEAMMLFAEAARRSQQFDLARRTLAKAADPNGDNTNDPSRLVVIANCYHHLGDRDTAMAIARRAAAIEPNSLADRFGVAQALIVLGREAEADRMLVAEVERDPNDPRPHFTLARRFETSGRVFQAVEHYRKAVELLPHSEMYRRSLARALMNVAQYDEALAALEPILLADESARNLKLQIDVLRGGPADQEAYALGFDARRQHGLYQARTHLLRGELDKCVEICTQQMDKLPDNSACRILLGMAYLRQGKIDDCLTALTPVITANPAALPYYRMVAQVMSRKLPADLVAEQLGKITGARKDMVRLAMAELYDGIGKYEQAEGTFRAVAESPATGSNVRYLASLGRAQTLAHDGKLDEALKALAEVLDKQGHATQTRRAMYGLLAAAGRKPQALAVLGELLATATADKDPVLARQVALWYSRQGDLPKALAACDVVRQARPDDPRSYVLRARALRAAGKVEDLDTLYRKAVELQPQEPSYHIGLADALDAQQKPLAALAALKQLEKLGETGQSAATFQKGMLYLRWGLAAEAAERFDALAGSAMSPQQRLTLGSLLVRAGQKRKAADVLSLIPNFAPQYVRAQQLLAGISDGPTEKLAILRRLRDRRPHDALAVDSLMAALMDEGKPREALAAFDDYVQKGYARTQQAAQPARRAVDAAAQIGDLPKAAQVAEAMVRIRLGQPWRWLAAALTLQTDPNTALLGDPSGAEDVSAMLGLCLSAYRRDDNAARAWAARLFRPRPAASQPGAPPLPPAYRLLGGLLVQDGQAEVNKALVVLAVGSAVQFRAGRELRDHARTAPQPALEVAHLLRAEVLLGLGHRALARHWALEVLQARPTCQWAATLLDRTGPGLEEIERAAKLLQPPGSYVAQMIQGRLRMARQEYAEAADTFAGMVRDYPKEPRLILEQAVALERAGWKANDPAPLAEAVTLYKAAWEATGRKEPRAANNAAYVISQVHPKDTDRLAEAEKLINAALGLVWAPQFLDTAGWIAHLQGRKNDACRMLRQAIKCQPQSAEVHYHVGWAEAAVGNNDLARRHMNAAVEIGERARADKREMVPAEKLAAERAKKALLEIPPSREGTAAP